MLKSYNKQELIDSWTIDEIEEKINKSEEKKMEDELKLGIGNEEFAALKPAIVKVVGVRVGEYGDKKAKKVVVVCKHPDKIETIEISSIKYENKGKLESVGLWINKDSKGLIRKGCALAIFLQSAGVKTIEQLNGKDLQTTTEDKGYLTFKGY